MALHAFKGQITGKSIQVVSVNITTVAYLTHLGGSTQQLSKMASAIWTFAYENSVSLSARHLAGKKNMLVDYLFRLNPKCAWQLHPKIFAWLDKLWGPHTVDRFATMANTQLPRLNSRFADPLTEGVDALAQNNWG